MFLHLDLWLEYDAPRSTEGTQEVRLTLEIENFYNIFYKKKKISREVLGIDCNEEILVSVARYTKLIPSNINITHL